MTGRPFLRLLAFTGALALAACSQGDANNVAADNGLAADETMMTNDLATTDLNIDANASAVDQAIDQTDQQSGVANAVGNTADSIDNTVE